MTDRSSIAEIAPQERNAGFAVQEVGALPWRIGAGKCLQILLITSRRRDCWTLPKGLPAKGRTAARSAALKAFEQVGAIGQINPVAIGGYSYVKPRHDGPAQHGCVTVFDLNVKGRLISWPERKQWKRHWFGIDEAPQLVAEPELAKILEAFDPLD